MVKGNRGRSSQTAKQSSVCETRQKNKKVLVNLGTTFSCLLFYCEYTVRKRTRGKGKEDK